MAPSSARTCPPSRGCARPNIPAPVCGTASAGGGVTARGATHARRAARTSPRRPSPRRHLSILLAVVALLAACDGGPADRGGADTDGDLEHLVAQNAELADRVDQLERRLEQLTGDGDTIDVGRIMDDLARVEAMADQLAEERDARLAFAQRVEELEHDLRASVVDLRDNLQSVRGLIDDLEVRYEVLQQRIDRLG